MAQWYYAHHGKQIGPIDEDTMRAWYKTGGVKPDQMVCRVGDQEWQRADFYQDIWDTPPAPEPAQHGPFPTPHGAIGGRGDSASENFAISMAIRLVIVAAVLLILGIGAVFSWALRQAPARTTSTSTSTPPATITPAGATWTTQHIGRLSLQCPFELPPTNDPGQQPSPEARKNLASHGEYDSGDGTGPRIVVFALQTRAGTEPKLDVAARASTQTIVRNLTSMDATSNPAVTSQEATIDGLAARRVRCNAVVKGESIQCDGVYIKDGDCLWGVTVAADKDTAPAAQRILDSIHIQPAPAPATAP